MYTVCGRRKPITPVSEKQRKCLINPNTILINIARTHITYFLIKKYVFSIQMARYRSRTGYTFVENFGLLSR